MKPVALVSSLTFFLFAASFVHAQGFRGSTRGLGNAGARTPSGAMTGQTSQRQSLVSPQLQRPSQPSVQSQNRNFQTRGATRSRLPGVIFAPALPGIKPVPPFFGSIPDHRRHHRSFPRHPGILILDVPRFAGATVITQVAPGMVRAERRYLVGPAGDLPGRGPERVAPFDPTPQEVVERMLVLADVKKGDVIYDLGSGDGRFLITAAKKYGVRGVGFEIDAGLVKLARENARREGVEKLVDIRQQDFRTADLSPATVVTLYLSYDGNLAVREQLNRQLKPGARVVSYTFDMGDWPPKITESYRDAAGDSHLLYLWEITAPSLASKDSEILQPHPTRDGPLIIEVR